MTIQQLSQEIGIGIDTLRIWERRYGFPVPDRDARGHRSYPRNQVEDLRVVKILQGYGQRPGKIFALSPAQRRARLNELTEETVPVDRTIQRLIAEMSPQQIAEEMSSQRDKADLPDFIRNFALPLLQQLDHDWSSGIISIAREHLISDRLETLLRDEFSEEMQAEHSRILFLTLNGERHKLGLLLAAASFQASGVNCVWLNEDLPLSEIPGLAQELAVDGVALSFSSHYPRRKAKQDLSSLRKNLDHKIRLIAGGQAVREIPSLPNLLICTDLLQIPQLVNRHFTPSRKKATNGQES